MKYYRRIVLALTSLLALAVTSGVAGFATADR